MPHPTARSFIPAITLLAALLGIASLLDFKETRQQQSLAFSRRNYDHLTNLRQLSSSSVPKTDEEQHAHIVHKIFPKWPHAFPCHQNTVAPSNKNELGLLLTKLPKCASSTMAGINMRIADKFAKENNYLSDDASSTCLESSSHKKGANFKNRHPKKSFLWSAIRDPTSRMVSEFFHWHVARKGITPNDSNFQAFCDSHPQSYISRYLTVTGLDGKSPSIPDQVQSILDSYDFIGIVERLDESLVAMQMILGLDTSYILHLNSKSSGGYDGGGYRRTCFYIPKSFVSPGMEEYFNSPQWKKKIELDVALWEAVNASLDATIEKLGRDEFNIQLARYRNLMHEVKGKCDSEAIFPCSESGMLNELSKSNCYSNDWGCGYPCIDEHLQSEEKSEITVLA